MSCGRCCGRKTKSILKGVEYSIPTQMSIPDYFRMCLQEKSTIKPDAPAILNGDGKSVAFTFYQLDSLSTKFAKALRQSLGFWTSNSPDGDLVMAFSLPNSEIIPIILLGILKLGAAFLPIPTTFAEQHIIKLVGVTRPMLVIIEGSQPIIARYECVSGLTTVFYIEEIMELAINGEFDDVNDVFPLEALERPCKRMASIIYTAGTMGQQLAVRLGHLEILNRCIWQYKTFPYREHEVASVSSHLEDVDSIAETFAPILAGIQLHIIPRYILANPTCLIDRISEAKLSRITLAPRALAALLSAYEEMDESEKERAPLASLQYWTISGDTLPRVVVKNFFRLIALKDCDEEENAKSNSPSIRATFSKTRFAKSISQHLSHKTLLSEPIIIYLYGSTEVTSDVTYETFENCGDIDTKFMGRKVSIGRPIANVIIYIVDDEMRIVEEGTVGEICIAGASVASGGYVGGTEADDAERFLRNPFTKRKQFGRLYETEDFGRIIMDKNGVPQLFFEGRTEMFAKVNGKVVDLRDIAKSVHETNLVEQCSAFCYHPGKEYQAIVACCKLLPDVTKEELEAVLRKNIPDVDLIPQIFPVEEFHYLPSGRLDKHKMFKRYKYHTTEATPEEWEPVMGYLGSPTNKGAAKALFSAIALYTGTTVQWILANYLNSMWAMGVNSINALSIFLKVRENGYVIELADFLQAESIGSIVLDMRAKVKGDGPISKSEVLNLIEPFSNIYGIKEIGAFNKDAVIELLSKAYSARNYMSCYLSATPTDYSKIMEYNWSRIMKDNLSVLAFRQNEPTTIVGACIIMDAFNELKNPPNCSQQIRYQKELFSYCEKKPKEHIIWRKEGTAIQTMLIGTSFLTSPLDNILLIMELLEGAKARAKSLGYYGAIISSAHPLLTNFCEDIMHNQPLEELPINKFRAKDKTTPFRRASPYHKLKVFYDRF